MIRTILESADHVEKVAKIIGPPKGLHHTLKMRFAEKVHIFLPSWLMFLVIVTSLADIQ